jgi:hypothetical protein
MIFYHDACPYGRLKMPDEVWDYVSSSWAYIPDATKRRADVVNYQRIEDVGVARFCERADEWFNENHPYGNPLEARRERLPEFGIAVKPTPDIYSSQSSTTALLKIVAPLSGHAP